MKYILLALLMASCASNQSSHLCKLTQEELFRASEDVCGKDNDCQIEFIIDIVEGCKKRDFNYHEGTVLPSRK